MLEPGQAALRAGLFAFSEQGTGGSNATVAACACGVETVWMVFSVSSIVVVDRCHVVSEASSSSGSEGVCTSPTEGTRVVSITSVCGAVVLVFAACVLVISVLEVVA